MRIGILARWLCLGFLAVGLSGCAHPSQVAITSNKLNAYHADIKRLLIMTDLGKAMEIRVGDQQAVFASAVTDSLSGCGIAAQVRKHDPLALVDEGKEAMQSFAPDTVMTIGWKTEQALNGIPMSSVLIGTIIDLKMKRQVWRAEINFVPANNAGQTLAASIIDRLKLESVLSSACVTPVVPKA